MATRIERKDPEGNVIFREEGYAEPHSVEVGYDARGNLYTRSIKAYAGIETDHYALEEALEGVLRAAIRVALKSKLIEAEQTEELLAERNGGITRDMAVSLLVRVGYRLVRLTTSEADEYPDLLAQLRETLAYFPAPEAVSA